MKQTDYTMRVITADDGYKLTQAADVELVKRTFTDKVYLAANANPDDWREIPDMEANALETEQRVRLETIEAEREAMRDTEMELPPAEETA